MNMRVKLFLDLVSKTSGPAKATRRDLSGIKREAQGLSKLRGGDQLARDLTRAGTAAGRARREIAAMTREANRAQRTRLTGHAGSLARSARNASTQGSSGGTAVLPTTRSLLAAGVSMYALKKGIDATVGSAVTFEAAMADVRKKVDLPTGQTWNDLEKTITKNAIAFGRSRAEIASLVAEAGAAGIAYEDLTAYTRLGRVWVHKRGLMD